MTTQTENRCMRCREDCTPVANLSADGEGTSFVCVGYNRPQDRTVAQDRFTLCWKNNAVDERGHWDKRDLFLHPGLKPAPRPWTREDTRRLEAAAKAAPRRNIQRSR